MTTMTEAVRASSTGGTAKKRATRLRSGEKRAAAAVLLDGVAGGHRVRRCSTPSRC